MNFDLDKYLRHVRRLDDADIDYDAFSITPLDPDTLRCLRYMHDVEHHTTCYLRDLLVTSAHDDPEITSFLAMWAYEEFWHGEAIAKVLSHHGESAGVERIAHTRARVGRQRLNTLKMWTASTVTDHVGTLALTWGAINEWSTQAAYLRLATLSGHPVLADLLRRIARQEGRHIDFYASQATDRLGQSSMARRLVRLALRRHWKPVGSGVMPPEETRRLVLHLFGDAEGERFARRLDDRIGALPGLDGLDLMTSVRADAVASIVPTAA